jgi:hypothetical protein
MLSAFLRSARRQRVEDEVVAYNDPQRDPNWCFAHGMLWPACAGMH